MLYLKKMRRWKLKRYGHVCGCIIYGSHVSLKHGMFMHTLMYKLFISDVLLCRQCDLNTVGL